MKQNPLFANCLKYGLYLGGINIVISLFMYAGRVPEKLPVWAMSFLGLGTFIIVLFLLLFYTKHYRGIIGGNITFGKAFVFGLCTIVVSTIVGAIYSYIFNAFIDPDYAAQIIETMSEKTANMMANMGAPDDQIEEALAKMADQIDKTTMQLVFDSIKNGIISGVIATLLAAAFIKKNPEGKSEYDNAMSEVDSE